jgi:hypothetical protein
MAACIQGSRQGIQLGDMRARVALIANEAVSLLVPRHVASRVFDFSGLQHAKMKPILAPLLS